MRPIKYQVNYTLNLFIISLLDDNDTENLYPQLNQNSDNNSEDTNDNQNDENIVSNDTNDNETKRKKKKKKRKKTENIKNQQQDMEYNKDIDEIEQSIWEVNQLLGEPVPSCSKSSEPQWINEISKEDILAVEHKHLNPYNELKKIFGSKTIQAERKYNCINIYNCIFCNHFLKYSIFNFSNILIFN